MKLKFDHFAILAPFYERVIPANFPDKLIALLNLPADGIVLDAGGGTGRVAQFLRYHSGKILVADQSLEMLKEAHKKEGLHTICSDTENSPFAHNFFDGIIMVDAFHHVANQRETANDLWRILKPGGRIVIEEPNVRSFRIKLIALTEKLALMRSHFLAPPNITDLFHFSTARVLIQTEGTIAWVIIEKGLG